MIDVNTMTSVGMANPNIKMVNMYDMFILVVCQSGVQLVSIKNIFLITC